MSHSDFILTLWYFVIFVLAAFSLGNIIFLLIKSKFDIGYDHFMESEKLGLKLIIGLGTLANIFLIEAILGIFYRNVILVTVYFCILLYFLNRKKYTKEFIPKTNNKESKDWFAIFIMVINFMIMISLYFKAMLPPYANDEMAYHIPEAQTIIASHRLDIAAVGHYFYDNIPRLMEVMYAAAISAFNFSLLHAMHLAVVLSFLIFLWGYLRRNYNLRVASLALLFILFYEQYTSIGVSGYIDSAAVSFEIAGLLLFFDWLLINKNISLILSLFTLGFALAVKYSAIPTVALVILTIILLSKKREGSWKVLSKGILLLLLAGGFWYLRNLYLYQNPFYPMYFGHKGVSDLQYHSLIQAIQQFGPRTFSNLRKVPSLYLNSFENTIVYYAFIFSPIVLFHKHNRKLSFYLLIYAFGYTLYWFFIATHQNRFLMPAILPLLILLAITLGQIKNRWFPIFIILFISIQGKAPDKYIFKGLKTNIYNLATYKLNWSSIPYVLGKETNEQFLTPYLGCGYAVSQFMISKYMEGDIIDNWAPWHDIPIGIYYGKNRHTYFTMPLTSSNLEIKKELLKENIRFIYYNLDSKNDFINTKDEIFKQHREGRMEIENRILKYSDPLYNFGPCQIYQIDFDKF